jgi:uncharacterized membrane protein YccF (DUF307 family)
LISYHSEPGIRACLQLGSTCQALLGLWLLKWQKRWVNREKNEGKSIEIATAGFILNIIGLVLISLAFCLSRYSRM